MAHYANVSQVPMSLAIFLATDNYDKTDTPNGISVTTLLKPIRQIVLAQRVPQEDVNIDLATMMANRIGSAVHDAIERAWKYNFVKAAILCGYPQSMIDKVVINPTDEENIDNKIPVYLENRVSKEIMGYVVTGKYDIVIDNRVEDYKVTSVWEAMKNNNGDSYRLQGSIYRWLNPLKITQDEMAIQLIFKDWTASSASKDPNYPPRNFQERKFKLLSLEETNAYVVNKLTQINAYMKADESDIPLCTPDELWMSEPTYKYYKNPEKTLKSTKNFDTRQEAMIRLIDDGSVGIVKEIPGQAKACLYCPAFLACSQKDQLIEQGLLQLKNH